MSNQNSIALRTFILQRMQYEIELMDDSELSIFSKLVNTDVTNKADKVSGATAGNFASLVLDVPTGKYDIADSTFNQTSFAKAAHTHSQYLRNDAANVFPSKTYTFLFDNDATHAAFSVTDSTIVVTNLNADYLDGSHASAFASKNHTHTQYVRNDVNSSFPSQTVTLTFNNDATHKPFAVIDGTIMVDNLNVQYLNGITSAGFALKNHTHTQYIRNDISSAYASNTYVLTFNNDATHTPFAVTDHTLTVTNLNSDYLRGKIDTDFFPSNSNFDTRYLRLDASTIYDSTAGHIFTFKNDAAHAAFVVQDSTIVITNLNANFLQGNLANAFAPAAHNHDSRYPQLVSPGIIGNFVSFSSIGGAQQDSGHSSSDYFPAGGNFDTRYFQKTVLQDYSTSLGLNNASTIEAAAYFIVGSKGTIVAGAPPAADGYVLLRIGGIDTKFLKTT